MLYLKKYRFRQIANFAIGDTVLDIDRLLRGQRFDTVVMAALIEHVERPYDLLRLVRGHIAPGGRRVVCTPNPFGFVRVVAELICTRRWFFTEDHTYLFPPRWVWRPIERSGYRILKTVGTGARCGPLWMPAPMVMSYGITVVAEPVE